MIAGLAALGLHPSIEERPDEPAEVVGGAVVGVVGTRHHRQLTQRREPGDRVLFYTDGVTEGRNLAGEPFGEARLADLLVRATLAGQPAAETMRRLAHAILAHQGRAPRDDATMVFLEWPGPPLELARAGGSDTAH